VHLRATPARACPTVWAHRRQWQEIRKSPVVEDAFLADEWNLTVTGADLPEDVAADYFSSNTLSNGRAGGAGPRSCHRTPRRADPQPVVVLSYKFWQRHFAADPSVLGKTLQMVHKNYTIVGVAAKRFTWVSRCVPCQEITRTLCPPFTSASASSPRTRRQPRSA